MSVTEIRASAVPAVPRQITATQRLAALELARSIGDAIEGIGEGYGTHLMRKAVKMLNEIAGDAKGER